MKHAPKDRPHVGGHAGKTHLDEGILDFFLKEFKILTMLDIGCGPGGMIGLATEKGINAYGIDGDYRLKENNPEKIIIHDFTEGPYQHNTKYNLGYSCEFLEHVYEQYMPNYMESFKSCEHIVITYAPEGTPGHHHVNCQNENYWIDKFTNFGFEYNKDITEQVRKHSSMKREFIRDYGLYFRKK